MGKLAKFKLSKKNWIYWIKFTLNPMWTFILMIQTDKNKILSLCVKFQASISIFYPFSYFRYDLDAYTSFFF